jgi:hypothetical protein
MNKLKYFLLFIMLLYLIFSAFVFLAKRKAYNSIDVDLMINNTVGEFLYDNGRFPKNKNELYNCFEKLYEKNYINNVLRNVNLNVFIDSSLNSFAIYDRRICNKRIIDKNDYNFLKVLFLNDNVKLFSDSINSKFYKNFYKIILYKDSEIVYSNQQDTLSSVISSIVKDYYYSNNNIVYEKILALEPYEPIIKNKVVFVAEKNKKNYTVIYSEAKENLSEFEIIFQKIINYLNNNYDYDKAIVPFILPQLDEAPASADLAKRNPC